MLSSQVCNNHVYLIHPIDIANYFTMIKEKALQILEDYVKLMPYGKYFDSTSKTNTRQADYIGYLVSGKVVTFYPGETSTYYTKMQELLMENHTSIKVNPDFKTVDLPIVIDHKYIHSNLNEFIRNYNSYVRYDFSNTLVALFSFKGGN